MTNDLTAHCMEEIDDDDDSSTESSVSSHSWELIECPEASLCCRNTQKSLTLDHSKS